MKQKSSFKKSLAPETFERAKIVLEKCLDLKRICSIAAGRLDGYFEKHIKPWDCAVARLILEELRSVINI